MVCQRCIEAVAELFQKLGIQASNLILGEATFSYDLSADQKELLGEELRKRGFDLLEDKSSRIVEQIKQLVLDVVHYQKTNIQTTFSKFLEREVGRDYSYLSKLFSSVEGITIEQFVILQKIEKAKELLVYDELSLSQISYQLNYSSVQHLSNQFKKVTGMSPSIFKSLQNKNRRTLDNVNS